MNAAIHNQGPRSLKSRPARPARLATVCGAVLIALVLTSCGGSDRPPTTATVQADADGYGGTLVDPPLEVAPVTLRDTNNQTVRLDRLTTEPDTITAVFFGFTNCPDICPTTMADLAAARRTLPADLAQRTHLVFVTVDPKRDTTPVLRAWLDQFDPAITGLRGPVSRVHRAERSLYASESGQTPVAPPEHDTDHHSDGAEESADPEHDHPGYEVEHSSIVYLFGTDGESIIYTENAPVGTYASDFTKLLN